MRRRGDLTLWFSADAMNAWHAPGSGTPSGQRVYADLAIETALTVRAVEQSINYFPFMESDAQTRIRELETRL